MRSVAWRDLARHNDTAFFASVTHLFWLPKFFARTLTEFAVNIIAFAQSPAIERTDDACFRKLDAAYDAYKSNGLRGNPGSLTPHIYDSYLTDTGSGVFCYHVPTDPQKLPDARVIGTYWNGALPGEKIFDTSRKTNPNQTYEQAVASFSIWSSDYAQKENCCGPEKAFYFCSRVMQKELNIPDCSQKPSYEYVPAPESGAVTTVGMVLNNEVTDEGDEQGIYCACVLNGFGNPANQALRLDEAAIKQVIQEYSTSGAERVVGVLVALACAMAVLA